MSKIVSINDFKDKKIEIKNNDSEENTLRSYKELREELREKLEKNEEIIVARLDSEFDVFAISRILMEIDESIKYCEVNTCISRISGYLSIKPIRTEKKVVFINPTIEEAFFKYVKDNNLNEGDMINLDLI